MPTITTTQTSSSHSIRPLIRFDIEYLKTLHGVLKVVLLVKSNKSSFCTAKHLLPSITGSWPYQHYHYKRCSVVWWKRIFHLNHRYRLVVHTDYARFFPVPRAWKVLHGSVASHWNWSDLHHHLTLLHLIADSSFDKYNYTYGGWNLWLVNDEHLRVFRIFEVQGLEKRWTCPRIPK